MLILILAISTLPSQITTGAMRLSSNLKRLVSPTIYPDFIETHWHVGRFNLHAGKKPVHLAKQKYTYDPETTQPGTGSGLGTGTYFAFPQLRAIMAGINLTF
jgi:hypothetical protein